MKILIMTVPHKSQRYPTCGDWFYSDGVLNILVSEEMGEDSAWLVAVHELIEAKLCDKAGITQEAVDKFDMAYEGKDEPGDSPSAPYFEQHNIATAIENMLCVAMGNSWNGHETNLDRLP